MTADIRAQVSALTPEDFAALRDAVLARTPAPAPAKAPAPERSAPKPNLAKLAREAGMIADYALTSPNALAVTRYAREHGHPWLDNSRRAWKHLARAQYGTLVGHESEVESARNSALGRKPASAPAPQAPAPKPARKVRTDAGTKRPTIDERIAAAVAAATAGK